MSFVKDIWIWFNAMGTLPWTIKLWAIAYPLPQLIGGMIFIATLPGAVILLGRLLSGIIASQIHKRAPFSKLMGPVGHAHWVIIVPFLIYWLMTQAVSPALSWFIVYVILTTLISAVIDIQELRTYLKQGHVKYKR
ncbi:MAG: hypothetical protein ACE37M_11590 [Henriciella sp.]